VRGENILQNRTVIPFDHPSQSDSQLEVREVLQANVHGIFQSSA
jgi:hypothetical protein